MTGSPRRSSSGAGGRPRDVVGRSAAHRAQQAPVITDNIGSQEMKQNGDRDAAAAMERVTGVSVVDNSVHVRAWAG